MGICQTAKPDQDSNFNKFKENEESLGLHHIQFQDLAPKMAAWKDAKVTADDYIDAISNLPGGLELTEDNKAVLRRLLTHSLFLERRFLNTQSLFSLGLLMSKGKTKEKMHQLIKLIDQNEDGILATTKVQQIMEQMTIITALLIPIIRFIDAFPTVG